MSVVKLYLLDGASPGHFGCCLPPHGDHAVNELGGEVVVGALKEGWQLICDVREDRVHQVSDFGRHMAVRSVSCGSLVSGIAGNGVIGVANDALKGT